MEAKLPTEDGGRKGASLPTNPASHCEDPESNEGDAAISPMDSDNVQFYDEPVGEKKYFVYILTNLDDS